MKVRKQIYYVNWYPAISQLSAERRYMKIAIQFLIYRLQKFWIMIKTLCIVSPSTALWCNEIRSRNDKLTLPTSYKGDSAREILFDVVFSAQQPYSRNNENSKPLSGIGGKYQPFLLQ